VIELAIFRDYEAAAEIEVLKTEDGTGSRWKIRSRKIYGNIIAEESIIGKSKDKIIKIPIRGLKEYQFIMAKTPRSCPWNG